MALKVLKGADADGIVIQDSLKRFTLNYTDIISNSNKTYSIEVVEANKGIFLYSLWGRTGGHLTKEYRQCNDLAHAELEAAKIIKSKLKKGYTEVELIKSEVGSDIAKSKIEILSVSENDLNKMGFKIKEEASSSLHSAVQDVVKYWFGSIEQFVVDTLDTSKCALGQLSLVQINKGRDLLLEARKLVAKKSKDISSLNEISNKYYSNIPMNFGYRKLNADTLRFDNNDKLDAAFDILDTLEGAKDAEKVLTKKSDVDEKYKSLKTEMTWVDPKEDIWKWINLLFHETRASNHHFLGKMKITNLFALKRDAEYSDYMNMVEKMASDNQARKELPGMIKPLWEKRVKHEKGYELLTERANILPLFHGSRTQNFPKILSSKLLMRKPGFTVSGSMYDAGGKGLYTGWSSKAINYSSSAGSYWSGGNDSKGYLFLSDVALGKQEIAKGPYPYTAEKIKPNMSVWAKGGQSGVINDEFIVYTEQQNWLRYVIEFETNINK